MHTRTRTTAAAVAIIGLLALPGAAAAGGWATVGLSSTPEGVRAGAPWIFEVEVLQHGRTPLSDVRPTVTISSGADSRSFASTPTRKPGVHRVSVRFPRAGTWRYVVDDGFTMRHTYPPVQIGASAGSVAGGGSDTAYDRLALAALAGLAAAAVALIQPRRRRRRHAAAATAQGA